MVLPVLVIFVCFEVCMSTKPTPELHHEWEEFKINYQKEYSNPSAELKRRLTWENNLHDIKEHNIAADNGNFSYWLGTNHLTDLTIEEVIEQMTGAIIPASISVGTTDSPNSANVPETKDWVKAGYVTSVKNQGKCGSCWAFSAVGAIEGQRKRSILLSEQQLVDCSSSNTGCKGGWPYKAYKDLIKTHGGGIDTEWSYPYQTKDGTCVYSNNNEETIVMGYKDIKTGDENHLKHTVATEGPVSVCIQITTKFKQYKTGVFIEPNCYGKRVSHCVLVVGYDTYVGNDYWLVKNSWGKRWGDKGYIKMSRNNNNQCSIATYGVIPVVQYNATAAQKATGNELRMSLWFLQMLVFLSAIFAISY